ncbi:hypothetical protein NSERUTF1_4034 [Nocardia seriolae]|nr:hypothetical protein NSERUTF1_4034 [Nocardia seriolae]
MRCCVMSPLIGRMVPAIRAAATRTRVRAKLPRGRPPGT